MSTTAAAGHVPVETLLAWWLHETDAAQTEAVDEHLMHCDACGHAVDALAALGEGVRAAFRAGLVGVVTTGDFVANLVKRGVRMREYRLVANGGVDCTVAPDDELLVSRLQAPLAGVERLDIVSEFSLAPGVRHRLDDIPFNATAGEVLYLPKIAEVMAAPAHTLTLTLVATTAGDARPLATYTFRHRPWETWRAQG